MAALCEFFRIGRIVRPHGVKGAVKLEPMSDSLMRYKQLKEAYIERNGVREPITVSDVGVKDDAIYMTLSCCSTRDEAEALRGAYVCVDRAHAMKLPKDTYFVEDLIGCNVKDTEGNELGSVTYVIETGANDVYVIKGEKTLMLPALKRVVLSTDIENRQILLDAEVLKEVGLFED
ncbi:MAG: 16S rRNA processing protein RimM [Eubacteriales bacterium]|jgi:16S rRNA processing protein RimM|nr:16S rRNA processing protein RimM [Eubacteriales bacterium]